MKVHAGVDAGSGHFHVITVTSANMHGVTEASKLLHKDNHGMYGDSEYLGVPKRFEIKNDIVRSKIEFQINKRTSCLKMADDFNGLNWDKKMEHDKSSICCKVEHAFLIVENSIGYAKVAYKRIDSMYCLPVPTF